MGSLVLWAVRPPERILGGIEGHTIAAPRRPLHLRLAAISWSSSTSDRVARTTAHDAPAQTRTSKTESWGRLSTPLRCFVLPITRVSYTSGKVEARRAPVSAEDARDRQLMELD